jgi:mRNA-degrading endonuclease YafQ of YafQ-DinJ toxin-antitoxin module
MPFKIIFTDEYFKKEVKFLRKHPDLKALYRKTVTMLSQDPMHNSLRLHKLRGGKKELYSVSINMQYRITMEFYITEYEIVLIDIGTHGAVYR